MVKKKCKYCLKMRDSVDDQGMCRICKNEIDAMQPSWNRPNIEISKDGKNWVSESDYNSGIDYIEAEEE